MVEFDFKYDGLDFRSFTFGSMSAFALIALAGACVDCVLHLDFDSKPNFLGG